MSDRAINTSALNEEALRRQQEKLRELNILRLQEKLLKSIVGDDSLEDSTSHSYFMDQLSLYQVSEAEKAWLKQLERDSGVKMERSDVYNHLSSLLTQFNAAKDL